MVKARIAKTTVLPVLATTNLSHAQMQAMLAVRAAWKEDAGAIVKLIIDHLDATITALGKTVPDGSYGEWRPELLKSVWKNLCLGAVWDAQTQANVLSVAADMGRIAVILAGANTKVAKAQVHAAFNAVSSAHTTCGVSGMGGGSWCDFTM
jgi:hypothetical protein